MINRQRRLERAKELIQEGQLERARVVLEQIADHPTAQRWLQRLDELDPQPQTAIEAAEELEETRAELLEAEKEIDTVKKTTRRRMALGTGALIFFGSLFGSLLGAAADIGDAIDTVQEVETLFYPKLCVVGSNTVLGEELGVAQDWATAFENDHKVRIQIDDSGSGKGVGIAADGGCVHVLAMSEPMTDAQYQSLVDNGVEIQCAAEIGYDIVVFITDINNPVGDVAGNELSRILNGTMQNWNEKSTAFDHPITIYARQGSGTTEIVLNRVIGWDSQGATVFPPQGNYVFCDSNDECLNLTLNTPGAVYWISAAWMSTQPKEYLRVLSVIQGDDASVNPLEEDVDLETYPRTLQRPLYMYVVKNKNTSDEQLQLAKDFLAFVRGVQGQKILEDHYFYTHFNKPTRITVPLPPGFDAFDTPNRQVCK